MTIDKDGLRLIEEGLKKDKAMALDRIRREVAEHYQAQLDACVGTPEMIAQAQDAIRKTMSTEIHDHAQNVYDRLEKMAYGEQGKDHAHDLAEKNAKIDKVKERWREQESQGHTGRSDWAQSDYSLSSQLNHQVDQGMAAKETTDKKKSIQNIREQWQKQKGPEIDDSGNEIDL